MLGTLLIVGTERKEALESSYARAFARVGWQVHVWDPMAALHRALRGALPGRLFATFVHVEPWWRKASLELLKTAKRVQPDLVLVIGTAGIRPGTLAQLRVRHPRCATYCLYPDGPHYLDHDRLNCLPLFDRVITSSPAWVEAFSRLGAGKVHYLPFAADLDLYRLQESTPAEPEYAHELAFIGTWRREREELLEQFVDLGLRIWGSDYWRTRTRKGSPLRRCWRGRPVVGLEFARVCAQSKIMLNILDPVSWPGPNMRSFELPACQAFALTERTEPILDIFREGETIECFDSVEEAREKIERYVRDQRARQRIAQASYEYVVEGGHTYVDRVRTLCDWLAEDGGCQD